MDKCMTKAERIELTRLARMRGNVAKKDLEARAAEQDAQVESQLAARYEQDHKAWAHITREANALIKEADAKIASICREMGIPEKLRPGLDLMWYGRGENATETRRVELRKVAQAKIEATLKAAKVQVDREVVRISTQLVAEGLTTEKARLFLDSMPSVEQLFPQIKMKELESAVKNDDEDDAEENANL